MAKAITPRYSIDKSSTAGAQYTVDFDDRDSVTFVAGGRNRYEFLISDDDDSTWSMLNGQIRFASGTDAWEAWALFFVCESDGGEVWDWGLFYRENNRVGFMFYSSATQNGAGEALSKQERSANGRKWNDILSGATNGGLDLSGSGWEYRFDAPTDFQDRRVGESGWTGASEADRRTWATTKLQKIVPEYDRLNAVISPTPTPPDTFPTQWRTRLTGQELKLVLALWGGQPKSFDSLLTAAWTGRDAGPEAVVKAAQKAGRKLLEDDYSITIRNRHVQLEKLRDK